MKAAYSTHKSPRLSLLERKVCLAGKTCASEGNMGEGKLSIIR